MNSVIEAVIVSNLATAPEIYCQWTRIMNNSDLFNGCINFPATRRPLHYNPIFMYEGADAVRQSIFFGVACGLDSLVLGEPQISWPIKEPPTLRH